METITIESLCKFKFVSDPGFSPDGTQIAFVVQNADLETNGYLGDLYLCDCEKKAVKRLTSAGDAKSYAWTERGTLLFAGNRGEKTEGTRYYEISPNGGEAVEKFEAPFQADKLVALGGGRYLIAGTAMMADSEEKNPAYELIDEVPFWGNGKGFTNGKRRHLYLYDEASSSFTMISEETAEVDSFSVRGGKVLYSAYPWTQVRGIYEGLYLYDTETGENRCLLEKDIRRIGMIALWADDQALVTTCEDNPYGNGKYLDFYTMDLADGALKLLAPYDYSSGSGSVGSDARLGGGRTVKNGDGCCYFISTKGYNAVLCRIDRDGTITEVFGKEGSCDSFDVKDGHIAVCGLYGSRLTELYLDGEPVTCFNPEDAWAVSAPEEVRLTSRDGSALTGWVLKPAGYQPGKKYPAILHIHGGPRTVFGTVVHHEMQVWASAGYFVFFTNPHGSDGFGTEFGDINGKYGTIDYDDLMDFTDTVLNAYPDIDRDRVGVGGGSYGGYMTNWIIGHTDRFKAAVSQRSIANWISFEFMSDIGHTFTKDQQSVTAFEDVHKLWQHSPMKYIKNCKTPTLFIHSDNDYRCPIAEGMEMFSALKLLGVETRLCVFHGENHELSRSGRPRSRIRRMQEILDWYDRYLKPETAGKEAR